MLEGICKISIVEAYPSPAFIVQDRKDAGKVRTLAVKGDLNVLRPIIHGGFVQRNIVSYFALTVLVTQLIRAPCSAVVKEAVHIKVHTFRPFASRSC
jgi:hypothetical protein